MHLLKGNWDNIPESYISWQPQEHLNKDLSNQNEFGHIDLPRLKKGGVNVPVFAAFAPKSYYPNRALDRSLAIINNMYHNIEKNPEYLELAHTAEDIKQIVLDKDKKAGILALEGMDAVKQPDGLNLLKQYRDLGVRIGGLAWNTSNELAEGLDSVYADGTKSHEGLTEFGEKIVKKMNKFGIVVDVSHLHKRSFWDVIEISSSPVKASHSSAAGVTDHRRNLTDDQIKALAEQGGVICIAFVRSFINDNPQNASVKDIVDHIEHVVELVGTEHVGLGSDFDGAKMPRNISDVSDYPKITKELLKRGYTKEEVKKILGKNILRVLEENQKQENMNETYPDIQIATHINMGQKYGRNTKLHASLLLETANVSSQDSIVNYPPLNALSGCLKWGLLG